ncbi:MAG TPA: helix-turn-helix domain-containing protein [Acidothermaceae bacterium]
MSATARDTAAARPMRADAQRNRDALLEAASAAFAENGVDTSLEDVAKRAGVGIGTLYRHFPTRDALIEAAYRRGVEQMCDAADELRATHEGDEALELWMQRFVGYVATKRGLAGALKLSGEGDHAELFAYVHERIKTALAALTDAAAATGRVRSDVDGMDLIRALSGICMVSDQAQEQARRLITLLMDGLRFGAPANTAGNRSR